MARVQGAGTTPRVGSEFFAQVCIYVCVSEKKLIDKEFVGNKFGYERRRSQSRVGSCINAKPS
jgi:hypothetical protein